MKLYHAPGACSQAVHIALREAGLPVDLVRVDLATHRLADGGDYLAINPRGYVPLLELPDGSRHTEVAAPTTASRNGKSTGSPRDSASRAKYTATTGPRATPSPQ